MNDEKRLKNEGSETEEEIEEILKGLNNENN